MCELCKFKRISNLDNSNELELAPAAYFAAYPYLFDNTDTEWMRTQIAGKRFVHNTGAGYSVANYCELCGKKLDYEEWVRKLWNTLEDIPIDPDTECIEEAWEHFQAGRHREEIWHWFEDTFELSVAEDLMGLRE